MINLLIVGSNSFVGSSVENWFCSEHPGEYDIDTVDAKDGAWKSADFSKYDVVFQVAGIAHVKKETPEMKDLFFGINADMTEEIAKEAKKAGVKQYIFMSTKGVYSWHVPYIDENTVPAPPQLYGKSKLEGEKRLLKLQSQDFKTALLRVPSIYGYKAAGAFYRLLLATEKFFVFPAYKNRMSLIYIDNFCEFVHLVIQRGLDGVLVPQDAEYVCTSDIVKYAAKARGQFLLLDYISWPFIALGIKLSKTVDRVFGDTVFKHDFSMKDSDYNVKTLEQAIKDIISIEKNKK